jgi:hypothetical protein
MWRKLRLLIVAVFATAFASPLASAHVCYENKQARDLAQLVDRSNLVFIGKAQKVVYRNAQGDRGEGVVPYTIVTYSIDRVLRGKPPGKELTMRFVGGPDGRGRFLSVVGVPVIQEGDRDLLFVANTDDASCPLVFCEYGRYRILNEQVFDTYGSPVRAIVKAIVISRGMPPKEFQTVRFPTPQFNELIQNPEVAAQLKSQNISEEDARRRYEAEAPKFMELKQDFPVEEKPTDVGKGGPSVAGPNQGNSDALASAVQGDSATNIAPEALPLSRLATEIELIAKRSKRKPVDLRSVDPAAEIVAARLTVAAPQQVAPPTPPHKPLTQRDADESKAFEQNGYDPVIKK